QPGQRVGGAARHLEALEPGRGLGAQDARRHAPRAGLDAAVEQPAAGLDGAEDGPHALRPAVPVLGPAGPPAQVQAGRLEALGGRAAPALEAYELGALRIAVVLQPVGEDEARAVLLRRLLYLLEERQHFGPGLSRVGPGHLPSYHPDGSPHT